MENIVIVDGKFYWGGRWWYPKERHGWINLEQKPHYWYDPSAISINELGQLALTVHKNKQAFDSAGHKLPWAEVEHLTQAQLTARKITISEWGAGTMCSVDEMGFGTYRLVAKLPAGNWFWPAWWMYPDGYWPPEIDIFEGYAKTTNYQLFRWYCKYLKWLGVKDKLKAWNLKSCIHTRAEANIDSVPAITPALKDFNKDPTTDFHEYKMIWTPLTLDFYIDGVRVRHITDKKVMDRLAAYSPMMTLITNQVDGFGSKKFSDVGTTPFLIAEFEYTHLIFNKTN